MKKKLLLMLCVIASITLLAITASQAAPQKQKDKIRIGWVTSMSGPYASGVPGTYGMTYDLWVEEINAKGGIFVKEYGKKLPLEVIKYDDKSDVGTMTKLLEKTILEDKVDFIFSPWGTNMLFAAAPIANKYKYILIGGPGGADKLKGLMAKLPYFFSVLNTASSQMPPLADVLQEGNIKKAAIVYIEDLHGIEYRDMALKELKKRGIQVTMNKSFPFGTKDLSPLLKEAKAANADAFLGFVYPDESFLITKQAMEITFNPKVFFLTVGPFLIEYREAFGTKTVEGVMGGGAWNEKVSPGAKQFREAFIKKYKVEPSYWGPLFMYSSLQFFEKAIEESGTLDQRKIRDLMASKTYDTAMGPMKFEKGLNTTHPGEIGQWQNGVYEVIDPGKKRTAKPIIPKPEWPKAK